MKIECPIDFMDLDILGFIDHNITVNIISNEQVVDKKNPKDFQKRSPNVIRCKNPRCITSIEQELDHIFVLTDEENQVYRCKYCEESIPEDKQKTNGNVVLQITFPLFISKFYGSICPALKYN